jgi:hypothetical protein
MPASPGLGIVMNPDGKGKYLADVEIFVKGKCLYRTPRL